MTDAADIGELVRPLDEIGVGGNGKCDWTDVATARDEVKRLVESALTALEARCAELKAENTRLSDLYGDAYVELREVKHELITLRDRIEREPVAYRYRYTDPITGNPVWRSDGNIWNGQRPMESQPLYAAPQLGRIVKELPWEEIHQRRSDEDPATEWNGGYEAETPFGFYEISMGFGSDAYYWSVTCPDGSDAGSDFESPEDALTAAQADYERRILSALGVEAEPQFVGSCVSCHGTGDQDGYPSYGACEDCDGSGRASPPAPVVTDQQPHAAGFDQWWAASKYRQVIFADDAMRRVALDGWNAALASREANR